MPRNFGHPSHDEHRLPLWPFVLIGAAVVLLVLFGIFFA